MSSTLVTVFPMLLGLEEWGTAPNGSKLGVELFREILCHCGGEGELASLLSSGMASISGIGLSSSKSCRFFGRHTELIDVCAPNGLFSLRRFAALLPVGAKQLDCIGGRWRERVHHCRTVVWQAVSRDAQLAGRLLITFHEVELVHHAKMS